MNPIATDEPAASQAPMASGEPGVIDGPAVTGAITLPEEAELPEGATWIVELQDTSKMDVAAETIGAASGDVEDITATEIPFAIAYDAGVIDERFSYTLSARVFDADGNLLYINDTVTDGIVAGEPLEEVPVQVQDVELVAEASAAADVPVVAQESPAA